MNKVVVITLGLLLVLTACSEKKEQTSKAAAQTKDQEVLTYADPIVDNLLEGFNEGSYQKFSRDFDQQMKSSLNANAFMQTRQTIQSKIGRYISRHLSRIDRKGQLTAVIYSAAFENEKGVTVRVVFQKQGESYLVTGLWFNSPKLKG